MDSTAGHTRPPPEPSTTLTPPTIPIAINTYETATRSGNDRGKKRG